MAVLSDTLKLVGPVISNLILPITLAYIGHIYSLALKEKETEASFVNIAVDVLKSPPTKDDHNIRNWATKIINRYSDVPLDDKTKADLIENISISSANIPEDYVLNVRTGPGTEFSVADRLNQGTPMKVLQTNGNWAKIEYGKGKKGWVSKRYLKHSSGP